MAAKKAAGKPAGKAAGKTAEKAAASFDEIIQSGTANPPVLGELSRSERTPF